MASMKPLRVYHL